ncbi:Dabb family protein [Streptomyces uncialis]|uniref:Dabb family protein n=1 Tax=Streptomyces uncialis TaxID=1048205 RepID=UPI00381D0A64
MESTVFGVVGGDIGDPAEGFTHTYSAAVTDLGALERYMYDPVHLAGDGVILPRLSRLSAVRFSDDPDPALVERINELYLGKRAGHPEWVRLLDAIPDTRLG